MRQKPETILIHGLWHQPAHFDHLAEELRRQGRAVHVPYLHRGSLAKDTSAVQEVVDACDREPVILGHSYGGSDITGLHGVSHLIYLAAFVPAAGESGALLGGSTALVNAAVRHNEDGTTSIRPDRAREVLYADCSEAQSLWATGLLLRQQPGHGRGVPEDFAWQRVESTYLKCEQDRALSPDVQESMGGRCTNKATLTSSHSPFISQVPQLARVVLST